MHIEVIHASALFEGFDIFARAPVVRQLCEEVGEIHFTRDVMPRTHFLSYIRLYAEPPADWYVKRPLLRPLRAYHELQHFKYQHRCHNGSWYAWTQARADSELRAALASEMMIYFEIPELRQHTFPYQIFVDRFLAMCEGWPMLAIESRLMYERMRVMNSPHKSDMIEMQLAGYTGLNEAWNDVWSDPVGYGPFAHLPAFRVVEAHLAQPDWHERHVDWLADVTDATGPLPIPFARQADCFDRVYRDLYARRGNKRFDL